MRSGSYVFAAIGLAFGSCGWADVPTADQVIAKSLSSYDAVKTYQGTLVIQIDKGDDKTRITLDLKAENGANMMIARSAIHLTTSRKSEASTEMLIIDNGTTVFTVEPKNKEYWEQPHGGDQVSGMFRRMTQNARSSVSKLKVTRETYHNRPVYKLSGSGVSGTVSIVIDRDTYQIYNAGGSSGVGAKAFRSNLTVTNQVFNKPISAAAFTWSPPAGFVKQEGAGQVKP